MPRLALMMERPRCSAMVPPAMIGASEAIISRPNTFTASTVAAGAMPGKALLTDFRMEATTVPWPFHSSLPSRVRSTTSTPPPKSSCVSSAPVSSVATPSSPVKPSFQAPGAWMRRGESMRCGS